jgi:hypothetical protein
MTSNRAIAAAMGAAAALGLTVDDAIVLQESNKLAVRLLPCDVLARVAEERIKRWAEFEVELASLLGHFYFGDLVSKWVNIQPALTTTLRKRGQAAEKLRRQSKDRAHSLIRFSFSRVNCADSVKSVKGVFTLSERTD